MSFRTSHAVGSSASYSPLPCRQFTFSEIELATQNFDELLVIGRGGFGKVYKGTVSCGESHFDVAIKRLDPDSAQGAEEFWAEVEMLSKLRHCHLVSLIGYCKDGHEMILVYEYMPYGTLADRLHKGRAPLITWTRRLKICIGAARGLDYLHTSTGIKHGVIHRDVKSSNILLDDNWAAKISDFGLSKISPINQPSSYVNTMVRGTFGYLDPDYYNTGKLTRKSDVYAFGVVLLEVLCEKKAVDTSIDEEECGLVSWAQDSIKEGRLKQIVDSKLRNRISPKCLKKFALLAGQCLHSRPKQRPTMAEVVLSLESILALQEKTDSTMPFKLFGRGVQTPRITYNPSSVGGTSLKSLDIFLYNLGGEDRIVHRFDFNTLVNATEQFSKANEFSSYGYFSMYKGRLQNGQDILITIYDDVDLYERCMKEASLLVRLEHENVIQMLGYCIEGTKVYIVYDFAVNATLADLIFDRACNLLDWNKRCKIILGVARVLVYLHNHAPIRIIHGNVKPDNILLDERFNPTLSGFYFAMAANETDDIHVDRLRSLYYWENEYKAPEYLDRRRLSTKVDVFSFGMVVLETVFGRKLWNSLRREIDLIDFARRNWLEGTVSNIIDPRIDVDANSITKFVEIGLLCVQDNPEHRPPMEEVVGMLVGTVSLTISVSEMRSRMNEFKLKGLYQGYEDTEFKLKRLDIFLYNLGGEDRIVHRFDFNTLVNATEQISKTNKFSSRECIPMYKGRLQNEQDILITIYDDFVDLYEGCMKEASLLVRLEHENVIQLLGYCIEGSEVYLVYDFAVNATLGDLIFDPACNLLDWNKRCKIILGVARVLVYLHNHAPIRIIHRVVNPFNILLDERFDPTLSGFYSAMAVDETYDIRVDQSFRSLSYREHDYKAPEYFDPTKADVLSFGLVVLETVAGQRRWDLSREEKERDLIHYARRNWLEGTVSNIIDPRIDVDANSITFVEIGLLCVQDNPEHRPPMEEVVGMLVGTVSLTISVSEMRSRMNEDTKFKLKCLCPR